MAIVAHIYPFIVGVDTHARNHVLSILTVPREPKSFVTHSRTLLKGTLARKHG